MSETDNPFESPKSQTVAKKRSKGIGRLTYCAFVVASALSTFPGMILMNEVDPNGNTLTGISILAFSFLLAFCIFFAGMILRFINVGISPWWTGLFVLPGLYYALPAACVLLPANFATDRRLDTSGKTTLVLSVLAAVIYYFVW